MRNNITFVLFTMCLYACGGGGGGSATPGSGVGTGEGSETLPVTLTINTPYSGGVGSLGTSYYKFTATTAGIHQIRLTTTQSDLSWTLYRNADFVSGTIQNCDTNLVGAANEICNTPVSLTVGTAYYFTVDEYDAVAGTYTLEVAQPPR